MEKFVKIGIVPIKRGFTDMVSALEQKNLFLNKCRQIAPDAVARSGGRAARRHPL